MEDTIICFYYTLISNPWIIQACQDHFHLKKSKKCHLHPHPDVEEEQTKDRQRPCSTPLPTLPSLALLINCQWAMNPLNSIAILPRLFISAPWDVNRKHLKLEHLQGHFFSYWSPYFCWFPPTPSNRGGKTLFNSFAFLNTKMLGALSLYLMGTLRTATK